MLRDPVRIAETLQKLGGGILVTVFFVLEKLAASSFPSWARGAAAGGEELPDGSKGEPGGDSTLVNALKCNEDTLRFLVH
ncbi:uncharacterized protein BDW43DRAFT_266628 [Aspergillus alliaceus]|uniref:uncharacterized protein n=1 Tax=Petromyces alliaceus TaxID=209559 RepID=UPI0012A4BE1D|nr:uncharacterized protein BDW43DRAFT_266628 [Aspergillus alliaceus]KAB8236977.1 hypothetical protein BDW43DRAFT_266628 [Aspergillus alliaceus]